MRTACQLFAALILLSFVGFIPKDKEPWDYNKSDWSAIMKSAYYNDTLKVGVLTKQGIDINSKNKNGWTALKVAVKKGNTKTVSFLLRHHANPNIADKDAFTPLMEACQHSYTGIVKLLLDKGANPDAALPNGWTAMMSAASQNNDLSILELLIQYKADVNAMRTVDGITALKLAEYDKDSKKMVFLRKHGAK